MLPSRTVTHKGKIYRAGKIHRVTFLSYYVTWRETSMYELQRNRPVQ